MHSCQTFMAIIAGIRWCKVSMASMHMHATRAAQSAFFQCHTAPTLPAGLTEALRAYLSALYDADTSCSTLESLNLLVSPNSCSNMLISHHTVVPPL